MSVVIENLIVFYVIIEKHVNNHRGFNVHVFQVLLIVQVKLIWGGNY